MAQDNTVARSLHDLGLAAWFGGSLMGAVGVNGAAGAVAPGDPPRRGADAGRHASDSEIGRGGARGTARLQRIPVAMPEGPHPFPYRTRKLSPPGPMVLRW